MHDQAPGHSQCTGARRIESEIGGPFPMRFRMSRRNNDFAINVLWQESCGLSAFAAAFRSLPTFADFSEMNGT
jgi:hypothetical protein